MSFRRWTRKQGVNRYIINGGMAGDTSDWLPMHPTQCVEGWGASLDEKQQVQNGHGTWSLGVPNVGAICGDKCLQWTAADGGGSDYWRCGHGTHPNGTLANLGHYHVTAHIVLQGTLTGNDCVWYDLESKNQIGNAQPEEWNYTCKSLTWVRYDDNFQVSADATRTYLMFRGWMPNYNGDEVCFFDNILFFRTDSCRDSRADISIAHPQTVRPGFAWGP